VGGGQVTETENLKTTLELLTEANFQKIAPPHIRCKGFETKYHFNVQILTSIR